MPRLVLASSSPRRRELLGRLALEFSVTPADIDETVRPGEDPTVYVERLAAEKAARVAAAGTVVVAADTAVVVDDEILGKPVDRGDALGMLARLSGREHQVLTAIWDVDGEEACGAYALNGLLLAAKAKGLQVRTLDVRNSGDTAGDRYRVVGYGAYALS